MSIFERKVTPIQQALIILAISVVVMGISAGVIKMNWVDGDELFTWSIATAFTMLFSLFNSLMSLQTDNYVQYWGKSMYAFMVVAVGNGLLAWLLSGVSLNDAGTYKFIYIVISMCFLVFLSMVNFIRLIVRFAEREEWNSPKIKRK
jgi:hypothetical protein